MQFHVHVKHWVVVWLWIGVVCGMVALVNIFMRKLSTQDIKLALFFGIDFWLLGGLACYGFEGVRIERPSLRSSIVRGSDLLTHPPEAAEWHSASDFLIPGRHQHLLP